MVLNNFCIEYLSYLEIFFEETMSDFISSHECFGILIFGGLVCSKGLKVDYILKWENKMKLVYVGDNGSRENYVCRE